MRKVTIFITIIIVSFGVGMAQNVANELSLEESYNGLQQQQTRLKDYVYRLNRETEDASHKLSTLSEDNKVLHSQIDSLQAMCESLKEKQASDKSEVDDKLVQANNDIVSNQTTTKALKNYSIWGCCLAIILVVILAVLLYRLLKTINKGHKSIDEIGKAQSLLHEAQKKLQEESIQLDNKLLELLEKQISSSSAPATSSSMADHSLALKVADEIVRIEMNLSQMDASMRGYKQLSRAVQRIKNNFNANGYEIVDMLGKTYDEGLKAATDFVTDDTMTKGERKITSITKPQVNYNGVMIQAAQITVSQNI